MHGEVFRCTSCDFDFSSGWSHHAGGQFLVCRECGTHYVLGGGESCWSARAGEHLQLQFLPCDAEGGRRDRYSSRGPRPCRPRRRGVGRCLVPGPPRTGLPALQPRGRLGSIARGESAVSRMPSGNHRHLGDLHLLTAVNRKGLESAKPDLQSLFNLAPQRTPAAAAVVFVVQPGVAGRPSVGDRPDPAPRRHSTLKPMAGRLLGIGLDRRGSRGRFEIASPAQRLAGELTLLVPEAVSERPRRSGGLCDRKESSDRRDRDFGRRAVHWKSATIHLTAMGEGMLAMGRRQGAQGG